MPELSEFQDKIEPFRRRLYGAAGMARAARMTLAGSDAQDEDVSAAECVLEELELLIAEINDGLDSANMRKAMEVQS